MNAGRKPESAPEGMMLPRQAAEILGVSAETVKKYIREGTLQGTYGPNEAGEVRYYASAPSVEAFRERKELDRVVERAGQLHGDTREMLLDAVNRQREEVTGKLDELLGNQREIRQNIERAMEVMLDAAQREKDYQERVLRVMEKQERVWWKRWLGIQ